jgi:hypothetical protein
MGSQGPPRYSLSGQGLARDTVAVKSEPDGGDVREWLFTQAAYRVRTTLLALGRQELGSGAEQPSS